MHAPDPNVTDVFSIFLFMSRLFKNWLAARGRRNRCYYTAADGSVLFPYLGTAPGVCVV
jgi:hypothetical protein